MQRSASYATLQDAVCCLCSIGIQEITQQDWLQGHKALALLADERCQWMCEVNA
jgi:hypothetical protein